MGDERDDGLRQSEMAALRDLNVEADACSHAAAQDQSQQSRKF
jgi:hypothetical protein